ncbi:TetR family transcriptional regulator [Rhodobacteraceae bacterium 2CG4]|uniref:TetR family transcriptional regulator n=1 Tax=Halovulum marinum TaxID=2662447 RepID=A0A6L5Z3N5_9RHOB|nr:TetR/AcrR family transcriptional regulator [Halovulum marinum]MSU91158.1 TetR family transcriptional regulator [Halovulum marinum]
MSSRPSRRSEAADAPAAPRRRLDAETRRRLMIERAAEHFARHGFDSPTRKLAADMGVTQALIYKHFGSKAGLIDRTLETVLGGGRERRFDPQAPLEQALTTFYRALVGGMTETRVRLFVRAGLDGRAWPTRRGDALTRTLFLPVIAGLRAAAGLAPLEDRPPMRGERELVMMLHAAMVFFGIRRFVYNMPMPENLDDVVALQVRTFVAGAVAQIAHLHRDEAEASLTLRLAVAEITPPDPEGTSSR